MTREDEKKQLKVTDRRMFTADGELRASAQAEEAGTETVSGGGVRAEPPVAGEANKGTAGASDGGVQQPAEGDVGQQAARSDATEPSEAAGGQSPRFSGPLPEPGFADLVSILAEPIALFLGDIALPDGKSAENLDLARFHIDLLGVLKQKTTSNLSQEESAVLEDLLYQLRMRYVQKSG